MEMTKEKFVTSAEEARAPALLSRRKRTRASSTQETSRSSFQFVNITEQPRHHASDQSVIRSQAMRSFLRTEQESLLADKEIVADATNHDETSGTTQHRFRLGPWGIQELAVKPRKPKARRNPPGPAAGAQMSFDSVLTSAPENTPQLPLLGHLQAGMPSPAHAVPYPRTFDGGNVDPFDSLPIPTSERTQFLLNYSHTQITSSPLMTYPKRKWFWLACKDPAYFHAALSHYSGHFNLSQRRGDPEEALLHRMKALKIINERLNTSDLATSDGTIGAISCMINYEANNGTLESVRTHVMGLEEVVKLRGGMRDAGFSTNLHRLVSWADINSANALSTLPLFPSIEDRAPQPGSPSIAVASTCIKNSSPHSSTPSDLQAMLADLRCLSSVFPRGDQRLSWQTNSMWYADILYNCKRSLIFLSHTTPQSLDEKVKIACSHAVAILVEICFRGVGINARIVDTLLGRLKKALEKLFAYLEWVTEDNSDEDGQGRMVFWAVCVGGVAAVGRSEGAWFAEHATGLAGSLNVASWKDAESLLESVLWHSDWGLLHEAFWRALEG